MKKTIETKAAKFEAGKTYFANWTACDGSDHVSTFMIEKRSAHSVTINGKRYMIPKIEGRWEYPAVEFIRATAEDGFPVYVEACNVFTTEANPDDYAVSQEAMDVAVDAETELANSEAQTSTPIINIADYNTMMTWAEKVSNGQRDAVTPIKTYLSKLGYTADKQDVFNAIDTDDLNGFRRYISQFPFLVKDDAGYIQKLYAQEDGQVVLAEIPTSEYPSTENNAPEFRYYIKSRRPIAGAVPKGYISATAGEMKAYSFCTDGSISRVPRKVVFGVAVYDHPLSDEQIINYDLHVDPRNPNTTTNNAETIDKEETQMTNNLPTGIIEVANGKDYYKERVELADKIRRDAQPCDDNDDVFNLVPDVDAFDDEQPTIRDKYWQARAWLNRTISKGKEYWFLFGRRVKKDSTEVAAYLYDYGLTPDKFAAEDQKVIDEEQRETAIRWANWQKEWFAEYLADKIKRDSKSYDDSDVVFKLTPDDDDDDDDELIDPPVDNTLTADIAKYQAAFDTARQISIRAGSGVCKINGEEIWFNYGNLRSISSGNYRAEITFNNGRKRFHYRGIVIKRADFLDAMNNEIVAAEQKEIFGEFRDDYQMPDTALDPNADYFQIRIFPKFANGNEGYFHATANDFNRALELIELFKSLNLPFIGLIKRNTVCGEEYYHHNRDGSETINPPQPKLPANIKDSLQRAMKAALEQYRRYNLNHNQKAANRERECFMICKKALKEVA